MATALSALPPGFELDGSAPQAGGLPDGFEIDQPHHAQETPSNWNMAMEVVGSLPTPMAPYAKLMSSLTDNEPLESKAVRVTQGALDPAMGIAQAVPHGLSYALSQGGRNPNKASQLADALAAQQDSFVQKENAGYEQMRHDDGMSGFDGYRMAGNVASPVNLIPGKAASMMTPAKGLIGKMVQGGAIGSMYGMTAPATDPDVPYADQKTDQAKVGGAFGFAAPAIGETLARTVKPNISGNAQALMDEGVRLTPGQLMGGALGKFEDAATSVPLVGDMIGNARNRSVEDLNKAVGNRALGPIGMEVPDNVAAGHGLVQHVKDTLGNAYDTLLPNLTGKMDQQFTGDLKTLTDMAKFMPPQQAKQFENVLQQQLLSKVSPNGSITGQSLKEIESAIGQQAKGYATSADQDQRNLGAALKEVQGKFREMIERTNPQHAGELQKINEGYANYARLRDAAAMQGAKEGVFTPAQLANAVKRGDSTVRKGGYATGSAMMQDLSDAAKDVLPSKMADSGTVGRAIANTVTFGGGALTNPMLLAKALLGSAIYTRPGVAAMETILAKRPEGAQDIADAIRKLTSPADLAKALGGSLSGASVAPSVAATRP